MTNKELQAEGITKEYVANLNMANNYSPVQLMPNVMPNEEPVKLMKCEKGYWVVLEFGKFLKDDNGKMVVIPEKDAKIGRARYLLNFADDIAQEALKSAIEKEYRRLRTETEKKTDKIISDMKEVLLVAEKIKPNGLDSMLLSLQKGNYGGFGVTDYEIEQRKENYAKKKEACIELATDELLNTYNYLKALRAEEAWDSLYICLFQDGLPELFSGRLDSEIDMKVLASMFHVNTHLETVEKVKSKGHLYVVAELAARKIIESAK